MRWGCQGVLWLPNLSIHVLKFDSTHIYVCAHEKTMLCLKELRSRYVYLETSNLKNFAEVIQLSFANEHSKDSTRDLNQAHIVKPFERCSLSAFGLHRPHARCVNMTTQMRHGCLFWLIVKLAYRLGLCSFSKQICMCVLRCRNVDVYFRIDGVRLSCFVNRCIRVCVFPSL